MSSRCSLVILSLLLLPAGCKHQNPSQEASVQRTTPQVPATPVGRKFVAWLEALDSADPGRLGAVHADSPRREVRVEKDSALAERTGGFVLEKIESVTDTLLEVVVQTRRTRERRALRFQVEPSPPHTIVSIMMRPAEMRVVLDAKAREEVIRMLAQELGKRYVIPDKAREMERMLIERLESGAYDRVSTSMELGEVLTVDLRRIAPDKHLAVRVAPRRPMGGPGGPQAPRGGTSRLRRAEADSGDVPSLFGEHQRYEGNIAYLEIRSFGSPPEDAAAEIETKMSAAADAAALILDLRSNGGGHPLTVARVSSYLFGPKPIHLNTIQWRVPERTNHSYTDPTVPGARFGAKKPIYVLTSKHTFSGGEEFTYNLQALKRATIVGETTGGGAHPGGPVPLLHGLVALVPSGRPVNPVTKTNWEGTGVVPDVTVPADQALETALSLAREKIAR